MATHSSVLAWRIPMDRGAWRATVHRVAESDMTEQPKHTGTRRDIMPSVTSMPFHLNSEGNTISILTL